MIAAAWGTAMRSRVGMAASGVMRCDVRAEDGSLPSARTGGAVPSSCGFEPASGPAGKPEEPRLVTELRCDAAADGRWLGGAEGRALAGTPAGAMASGSRLRVRRERVGEMRQTLGCHTRNQKSQRHRVLGSHRDVLRAPAAVLSAGALSSRQGVKQMGEKAKSRQQIMREGGEHKPHGQSAALRLQRERAGQRGLLPLRVMRLIESLQ
jgi:hypothetical protein